MASLVLVAVFGVPALSDRIAPLIPLSVEHRLGRRDGRAGARHARQPQAPTSRSNAAPPTPKSPAAPRSTALIGRLETAAGLPIPLKAVVVRRREANAIALPGGHIYVFEGLVTRSRSPDELAGVIAHEIGHVAHRDGTRSLLQSAGLSFLFGMLLGDFTGGGVVVIAARTVVQSAYSREVEAAADLYGVQLDVARLAAIHARSRRSSIASPARSSRASRSCSTIRRPRIGSPPSWPPCTRSRRRSSRCCAPAEWAALKRICG